MTNQTKCPHCGAELRLDIGTTKFYVCGSMKWNEHMSQSDNCHLIQLRAKVAAQQELLRELKKCPVSIGTQTVTAVIPFDIWEKLEAHLEQETTSRQLTTEVS